MLINHAVVSVLLFVILVVFFFSTKKYLKTKSIVEFDPNNKTLNTIFIAIFNLIIAAIGLYLLIFLYSTLFNFIIYFFGDNKNMLSIDESAATFANLLTVLTIISAIILVNNNHNNKSNDEITKNINKLLESNIQSNADLSVNISNISKKLDKNDQLISDNLNSNIESQYTTLILGLIKDNHDIFCTIYPDIENLVDSIQVKLEKNYGSYIYLSTINIDDKLKETIITNLKDLLEINQKNKDLIKNINRIIKEIKNNNFEMISSLYLFKNQKFGTDTESYSDIKSFYLDNNDNEKSYVQNLYNIIFTDELTKLFNIKYNNFDDYYKENATKYSYIKNICSEEFEEQYYKLGHFYRHIHRIIKTINHADNYIDPKIFLGILRAQLSEKIIISLYYNCIYTEKGYGMGLQLIKTDFFGTHDDFSSDYALHFSIEYLLNAKIDTSLMEKLFCSNSDRNVENFDDYSELIKREFLT